MLTFNHERYISHAIESILSQKTRYRFELLIGDDCSTDGTRRIIRDYSERYPDIIRVFYNDVNVGITRNSYSLDVASNGKYIAACDGDDYWCDDNRIENDINFLECHQEYMGICHKCRVVDDEGKDIRSDAIPERQRFWQFDKNIYSLCDFEKWLMPGHGSAMTGRNVISNYKQDAKIVYEASDYVGDRTHVLMLSLKGEILCDNQVVSCYRFRNSSGGNFLSLQSKKNLRYEDYKLMDCLEKWVSSKHYSKIDLSRIKKDRFVGSIITFMKDPKIDNLKVVSKIFVSSDKKIEYLFLMTKVIFVKSYYWLIKKQDYLIDV